MNNLEVFEQYNTEKWVLEEALSYLLMEYRERCINEIKRHSSMDPTSCLDSVSPVATVKEWINEETLCSVKYAEKSKMNTLESNTIEGDYLEIS